jgi:maltose O-acetyltransferase
MIKILKRIIGFLFIKLDLIKNACIYERYRYKYKLNSGFRFNGLNILFYGNGEIIVGDDSYIGEYSTIQAIAEYKVIIGNKCQISHNVRIYTGTDQADQDFSLSDRIAKNGNVIIEDYVWIGANVFINPGIIIGKNSIVGANSVVTKNVMPNTIVGGVPAKLIRNKLY